MLHDGDRINWAKQVERALRALDPHEQLLVRLSYCEGLSQAGIAARTGESLGVVSHAISSGMRRLALALEPGALGA